MRLTTDRTLLEVLEPGLLTTIQDAGRADCAHLGVPVSGACDPWALAQANLLLGNEPHAPAIEITLEGPSLRMRADGVVALGGADLGAHVPEEFRDLAPGAAHRVRRGTTIRFATRNTHARHEGGGRHKAAVSPELRAYLALPGGVDVARLLGSASTYLAGGFGGYDGRALEKGDRIGAVNPSDLGAAGRTWPEHVAPPPYGSRSLRVVRGPHADLLGDAFERLLATEWRVQPESNRSGVRLAARAEDPNEARVAGDTAGPERGRAPATSRRLEVISLPMIWGAVQVPPDGRPILLLGDFQTVGGYPVAAVVVGADWPRLGQLAPGASVRFELVEIAEAQRAWRRQHDELVAAAEALRSSDAWDALADVAS